MTLKDIIILTIRLKLAFPDPGRTLPVVNMWLVIHLVGFLM